MRERRRVGEINRKREKKREREREREKEKKRKKESDTQKKDKASENSAVRTLEFPSMLFSPFLANNLNYNFCPMSLPQKIFEGLAWMANSCSSTSFMDMRPRKTAATVR